MEQLQIQNKLTDVLLPELWDLLGPEDRRALRAVCREARRLADCLVQRIFAFDLDLDGRGGTMVHYHNAGRSSPPATPEAILGFLHRFLGRGGRPRALVLRLSHKRPEDDRERVGRDILSALAAAPRPRPLESLTLQGVPLSADVIAALAAAAPGLQRLKMRGYDMSAAAAGGASAAAAAALVRVVAPGLQQLSLEAAEGTHGWSPELIASLQQCTCLEYLSIKPWRPFGGKSDIPAATAPLLEALSTLPNLYNLKLRTHPRKDDKDCVHRPLGEDDMVALAAPLRGLAGLTRLRMQSVTPAAVLPALPHLTALAALELPNAVLTGQDLQHLQAARSLRWLLVHEVRSRGDPPLQPGSLPLPPSLQSLEIIGRVEPHILLALQLPPSLKRLQPHGLLVNPDGAFFTEELDTRALGDDHDSVVQTRQAMEALMAACVFLGGRGLFDGAALPWPFSLAAINLSDPRVVPGGGGFRPLAAALGRLGLRGLELHCWDYVDPEWFEAVAEELPALEALRLRYVAKLPHTRWLRRLGRLEFLELPLVLDATTDCTGTLYADVLDLVCAVPSLRHLCVAMVLSETTWRCTQSALARVREELHRLGREPVAVSIYPVAYMGGFGITHS